MDQPRILVVEDDVLIRTMAVEALTEAGLAVIEAATIDAAMTILEARAGEIAVVFCDIETPGVLSGFDLARHAQAAWPHVTMVLTSGRTLPEAEDLANARFVGKPYHFWSTAQLLRGLVQSPDGEAEAF